MDEAAARTALERWIACARLGQPAPLAAGLSPGFTRHIGLDAGRFAAQEAALWQAAPPPDAVQILSLRPLLGPAAGAVAVRYRVLAAGFLLFQAHQVLAADGLILGDGSAFDVVPKLRLGDQAPVRRALAVRGPAPVAAVVARGAAAGRVAAITLHRAPAGEHQTVTLDLHQDDGGPLALDLRLLAGAARETVSATWPGLDDPWFRPGLTPHIAGATVTLAPYPGRYWSLAVTLADGRRLSLAQPAAGVHRFDGAVSAATLTDALDCDWVAATG